MKPGTFIIIVEKKGKTMVLIPKEDGKASLQREHKFKSGGRDPTQGLPTYLRLQPQPGLILKTNPLDRRGTKQPSDMYQGKRYEMWLTPVSSENQLTLL